VINLVIQMQMAINSDFQKEIMKPMVKDSDFLKVKGMGFHLDFQMDLKMLNLLLKVIPMDFLKVILMDSLKLTD